MQAKMVLLSALAGGVMIGTLGGLASNPVMVPPPEPAWRQLPRAQIDSPPADFADAAMGDFRAPWLHGPAPDPRGVYARYETPAYEALNLADYRVEAPAPLPEPYEETAWRDPAEGMAAEGDADAAQAAARDARQAMGDESAQAPADAPDT